MLQYIRVSIVVSISACHADDPGSIPGRGTFLSISMIFNHNNAEEARIIPFLRTKTCRDPGSNRGPPDLQSDALPTELSRLEGHVHGAYQYGF